ncbi:MAG: 50S ribosomal protein L9 [Candidatus Doudnabacteria bacterium]|nr:50S ribosomal protein L9 [Candidatus Doudnabacteria bacterium]
MKVILTDRVHNLGNRGDIMQVNDGYARNFLFPNRLAAAAGSRESSKILKEREQEKKLQKKQIARHEQVLKFMAGKTAHVSKKIAAQGTLYAGVNVREVVQAVRREFGAELTSDLVSIPVAIKKTGTHNLFYGAGDRKVQFFVEVSAM